MGTGMRRKRVQRIVATMFIGSLALFGLSFGIVSATVGQASYVTLLASLGVAAAFLFPLGLLGALIDDVLNRDE